ncbi:MAG: DMT family transporter [Pseudomonadota bacterium]|nr:DMT family transporter [Pseudomonadota bacterium]
MSRAPALHRRGLLLVFLATVLWSLAGLFTRAVPHLDFGAILFGRAGFGGVCGLMLAVLDWRAGRLELRRLRSPMTPVILLLSSTAISGYVAALLTTTVADVLVIYATLPFIASGLAVVVTGERPSRRTMIAASFAMIGVFVMVADGLGHGRLLGQALSLFMTAGFAGLVVLQRRDPDLPVAPINAAAALIASGFGFAVAGSVKMSAFDVVDLFFFGVTTITIAFALFMQGAKTVPPAEASLIAMLDVVLGPLWVWLAFREQPSLATAIGGGFVLAAALWRLAPELRRRETLAPAAPLV